MNNNYRIIIIAGVILLAGLPLLAAAGGEDTALAQTATTDTSSDQDDSAVEDESESDDDAEASDEDLESFFAQTTVTATGQKQDVFDIATPVAVIPEIEIERKLPENPVDLFRSQPGVDVNGVGPNQARPIIRGQRGLRVLFMENGLRMNNARRQTDFGEVSGLVDMDNVQSLEVVRGPASVLYGTDAIGGVLNLVTKTPEYRDGSWIGAAIGLRYGSSADQGRANLFIQGRQSKWSYNLGLAYRDSDEYESAAGTFGDITLDEETVVNDTSLKDDSIYGFLAYDLTDSSDLSFRFNRYRADQTGFGWIDPLLLGELDRIRILYPFQDFDRYNMEYRSLGLDSVLANTVDVNLMYQNNERELKNEIDAYDPVGGPVFFHVAVNTENFTDLETWGLRGELTKILGEKHLLTYGGEFYDDDSFNTDQSLTQGFIAFQFDPTMPPVDSGPPVFTAEDDIANTPNAENLNYGVFVQDQFLIGSRLSGTAGVRYSKNESKAKSTPGLETEGLDFDDGQFVGAVSLVFNATPHLNIVGGIGTAFRAPNIVERLFNGPTPEGVGYQILNPNLESEKSENYDIGLKYRRMNATFEIVYFNTEIDNGIIQYFLSDEEIEALPPDIQDDIMNSGATSVVQQRNIDKLKVEGIETIIGYHLNMGLSFGANYTWLDGERVDSDVPPTGDTYSNKFNFYTRYDQPKGRFWAEYRVRANGSADSVSDPNQPIPPVGATLPSFEVHTLSGGVVLFRRGTQEHSIGIVFDNFTDELYSEFSNASFFRPQPGQNIIATYRFRI